MSNRKTKRTNPDEVPNLEVPIDVLVEQQDRQETQPEPLVWAPGESLPRYVVVRDGLRVSDKDYPKADEPRAIAEKEFWQKVVTRWPDGTKVEIVQYDKKKHRIW
jgi:hypothetical protein